MRVTSAAFEAMVVYNLSSDLIHVTDRTLYSWCLSVSGYGEERVKVACSHRKAIYNLQALEHHIFLECVYVIISSVIIYNRNSLTVHQ